MSLLPLHKLPGSSLLDGVILGQTTSQATSRKVNLTAVTDPAVGNDNTQGYGVFSIWVNTATDRIWFCTDAGTGAAVWKEAGGAGSSGTTIKESIAATAHGFSATNAARRTSTGWAKAQANSAANAEVMGLVESVADADNFTIVYGGKMLATGHGFTIGDVLFSDPTTAGAITATEPSTPGQVSKPVAIVLDANYLVVINMRGSLISGANGPVTAKTSSYSITSSDSGTNFTNEGASAIVPFSLPTAVAGLRYTFTVQDADGLKVTASGGDTIRIYNLVSITAGYIQSTAIGSTVELLAINATEWVAKYILGPWDVQTS